ncbi:MAG: hypothetical protein IT208_12110 [Chthonomonadales bacterium]|nr:hypothetical protein [Chthonomonadales bacterium]
MRRSTLAAALAAASLLLAGSAALAQAPAEGRAGARQGRRAARGVSVAQLPIEALDAIVKLTPEQRSKLAPVYEKHTAAFKELREKAGAGQRPDREQVAELNRQVNTDVMTVLTDEQKEMLKKALPIVTTLRQMQIPPQLGLQLHLTDEQKTKVFAIVTAARENLRPAPGSPAPTPEARRSAAREVLQKARAEIEALLTAEQKATIEQFQKERRNRGNRRPAN